MKKIFISYSWESEEHKDWVKKLADDLDKYPDIHVVLDQYDLNAFMDKNLYMEQAVHDSDFIIIVATPSYTKKANSREGGVGIETLLNTANHWDKSLGSKKTNTIAILRNGKDKPRYLKGHFHLDFNDDSTYTESLQYLLDNVNGKTLKSRPKKTSFPSDFKKKIIN